MNIPVGLDACGPVPPEMEFSSDLIYGCLITAGNEDEYGDVVVIGKMGFLVVDVDVNAIFRVSGRLS